MWLIAQHQKVGDLGSVVLSLLHWDSCHPPVARRSAVALMHAVCLSKLRPEQNDGQHYFIVMHIRRQLFAFKERMVLYFWPIKWMIIICHAWYTTQNFQNVNISKTIHSTKHPVNTHSGIYCIEGPNEIYTQSAEVRLVVSGGQALFTLGFLKFALPLVDVLSDIFCFCQMYNLKDTHKISKKNHVGLKFEWGL